MSDHMNKISQRRENGRLLNMLLCICSLGAIITTLAADDSLCNFKMSGETIALGVFRSSPESVMSNMTDTDELGDMFTAARGTGVTAAVLVFLSIGSLISHNHGGVGRQWIFVMCSAAAVMALVFWVCLVLTFTNSYRPDPNSASTERLSDMMNLTYGLYISVVAMLFMSAVVVVIVITEINWDNTDVAYGEGVRLVL